MDDTGAPLAADHALADDVALFRFASEPGPRLFCTLDARGLRDQEGIRDAWTAYDELAVAYDPALWNRRRLRDHLHRAWSAAHREPTQRALRRCPVSYHGEDLALVAEHAGLAPEEVVRRHSTPEYVVAALGFLPDFAYLWGLDPALAMPRRGHPRPRVPAGAVAIGGDQTAVYPQESPGGWRLIGHCTPDAMRGLQVGDRVRFDVQDGPG